MGGNLAKSPLTALFYAALLSFTAVFLPFSQPYAELIHAYELQIPWTGYLLMIAYCLWALLPVTLALSTADKNGVAGLASLILPCLGLQWIVPLIQPLAFGDPSGSMAQSDILLRLIQGCAVTLFTMILSWLLTAKKPPSPSSASAPKYKLKPLQLVIFLLVLPIIYSLLYFILGYVLAWRQDAIRIYYQWGANEGFMHMIINMLLEAPRYALFALLRGLLISLFSLPLLLLLPGKRAMYIICHTMFCLSGTLLYLLPNPVIPSDVANIHLIAGAAITTVFAGLSGYLLHLCVAAPKPVAAVASKAPAAAGAAKPKPSDAPRRPAR